LPDDSPGAQLKASTGKLEIAVKDIQNIKNFFNAVAEVINSVNTIVGILL
jgi:hypothetical protein